MRLTETMDAHHWASSFCNETGFKDFDLALGWFANAIMVGHDMATNRERGRAIALEAKLAKAREALKQIEKICDKPWGVLTSRVWTVQDDDYEAWYLRDLAYDALKELADE